MRTAIARILVVAVALLSAGSALAQSRAETILVIVEQGPNSLDIHGLGANFGAYQASWNLYDRLISFGSKTLPDGSRSYDYTVIRPELAESWEVSPDGLAITFRLRKDARFHDGARVTAHDVKWSLDRAIAIGGFPAVQMRAGSLEKPEQFSVVDDHTVRVTLPRRDKLALPNLAVPVPVIINSTLAKKHATEKDPWAAEWLKQNPAGGGAYRLESWKPGQETVYVRFDDWKSGPRPAIRRVVVREVPAAGSRRALLERGDADITLDLPPKDFNELKSQGKLGVFGFPAENTFFYVGMSAKHQPFANVKVRQAIAHVLPYERIYQAAMFGRGVQLQVPVASNTPGYEPALWTYRTDVARAKALLAEAGHPNGFETALSFNLGVATVVEPAALLVQEALAQIGIKATINKITGANWRGALAKKELPIFIDVFGGWHNYPEYYFFWGYHGQNSLFNTSSYQNAEMDKLIDQARFETDPRRYADQVRGFVRIAVADVPKIPLFQPTLDAAMQKSVTGFQYWFHRQLDFRTLARQ